jgi:hypothetical protein
MTDLEKQGVLGPAPVRGFQWDLARQVERPEWLAAQLPRYAALGYQELYLNLEDAVEYPSLPGVARRDAYSRRQLGHLVDQAGRAGLKVVPIVSLLGHTDYLIRCPGLRDLNELRAPDGTPLAHGQICPLHPRTPEVAGKLLADVAPFCTAGKVHVGLDESYHLGRHPLSRAEIAEAGLPAHFARHVRRLREIAAALGLRIGMWADMLALLPQAIPLLPGDVAAYDWYYHPFRRRPRLELRNFADYDLSGPLRRRGIEYWGCPMSGAFRHEPLPVCRERLANIAAWWRRCRLTGAAGMLVTSWEPARLAAEIPAAIDAAAAGLWLDGEEDPDRLLESGCRRRFGRAGRRAAAALRDADKYPFIGYMSWRINGAWDAVAGEGRPGRRRAEAGALRRLSARRGLPPAVGASLRFRAYLAARDAFVRSSAQGVWRMRAALGRGDRAGAARVLRSLGRDAAEFGTLLARGRRAARAMWLRTRDTRRAGPNEDMVGADAARLRSWRAWLRGCRPPGTGAWDASPVAGAWQLLFTARNFEPALQRVVVERRTPEGGWREIAGTFLIEFLARSARPRSTASHRVSLPVAWEGPPSRPPALRIAVRGFGRVAVGAAVFTNGPARLSLSLEGAREAVLGRRAPASGFPELNLLLNRASRRLVFPG